MSARREEAVLRRCYYCAATLVKRRDYQAAADRWKPLDTGDDLAWVNQQWQQEHGAPYEHLSSRGARHKCPQCRHKIAAFPPRPAGGAAAAVPPAAAVAPSGVAVRACRYLAL